jgi:hypothetical protein
MRRWLLVLVAVVSFASWRGSAAIFPNTDCFDAQCDGGSQYDPKKDDYCDFSNVLTYSWCLGPATVNCETSAPKFGMWTCTGEWRYAGGMCQYGPNERCKKP